MQLVDFGVSSRPLLKLTAAEAHMLAKAMRFYADHRARCGASDSMLRRLENQAQKLEALS